MELAIYLKKPISSILFVQSQCSQLFEQEGSSLKQFQDTSRRANDYMGFMVQRMFLFIYFSF